MISKVIQLFFLWRRNDARSILFKCTVWAALATLVALMFTDLTTACVIGVAAMALAAMRYGFQYRRESAEMMNLVGGDPEKYRALRAKLNAGGSAAGFMSELMREAVREARDQDDDPAVHVSESDRQENRVATLAAADAFAKACTAGKHVTDDEAHTARAKLLREFASGDTAASVVDVVGVFVPEGLLYVDLEDYCNSDDHANLLMQFAHATRGKWQPENCTSVCADDNMSWTVTFTDAGEDKTWNFKQEGDWLSNRFLEQLINYAQARSGYVFTTLDDEDMMTAVFLPPELHALLLGEDQLAA